MFVEIISKIYKNFDKIHETSQNFNNFELMSGKFLEFLS